MSKPADPMKSFGGVMAATLALEVIVVLLALLALANLDGGLTALKGAIVAAVSVALVVNVVVVRRPWSRWLTIGIQVVLLASFPVAVPLGIVGVIFGLVWGTLLWMRWDVAKRMAQGQLPSQQASSDAAESAG
jgi:hypothetical protein